jgi:flagellar biosynthesis/type III secretory pathway protein FliH
VKGKEYQTMAKILKGDDIKRRMNLQERLESDASKGLEILTGTSGGILDRGLLGSSEKAKSLLHEAKVEGERIKEDAREILEQAKEEVKKTKQEGYDRGFQEGLQQGLELLVKVKELRRNLFEENEKEMIRLVFAIAEKVIGRELNENDKAILNVIRLAIHDAVGEKIYVHVSPQDYANVRKSEKELIEKLEYGKTLLFREDASVKKGGCVIETEIGTIDAQLETQLQAIKKALGL